MAAAQIDSVLGLKCSEQMLGQQIVEVVPAQTIVAMAGQHLGDVALERDDGDIEGAAAQIVDHGDMAAALSIGQACGSRFIQNADGLKTCQCGGLARGLALSIGEIGGNGNDCLGHGAAELLARPGG